MIARTLKQFYARGLHQLVKPAQAFPVQTKTLRQFSASAKSDGESEDVVDAAEAAEDVPTPAPQQQQSATASNGMPDMSGASKPMQYDAIPEHLFTPFDLGNIKKVDSTPDHQPPSREDTIEGRYAGVLFTHASQMSQLYDVFEDVKYLQELFTHCESFRLFTENQGVGRKEILELNEALKQTAPFSDVTLKFLEVLAENKRLVYIGHIADRYSKLYQEFNKEEKVTIISAKELTEAQKSEVLSALMANPQNQGKEFTVEYEIDETILGGLQMYSESEFMDMSLSSRMSRLTHDVERLTI